MTDDLAGLPDDVRAMMEPSAPQTPEMLASISEAIAKKRDEAKAARKNSAIETTWREAEEAYAGIDDANRHEFTEGRWSKPASMDGPVTTGRKPLNPDYKSTVFVPLTARYVRAGAAKLGEILLPLNDKAFSFSETPVPDLIKAKDDTSQVVHDGLNNAPLMRDARPDEIPPAAPLAPGLSASPVPATAPAAGAVPAGAAGAPQVPLTVKDLAEENIALASKKAKAAETRIYDWMVQSKYPAEARKVIFDAARIGVGVLKGPFPKSSRDIAIEKSTDGGVNVQIKESIFPAAGWVDPWKFYPAPGCGENIHDGPYVLEEDWLAEQQVRDLKEVPGYIAAQIDKVLEEGPDKINAKDNGGAPDAAKRKDRYQVWYYYGSLKREEMSCLYSAAGKQPMTADEKAPKEVYVIATLINDSVIRAVINPLDSGTFPYNTFPWQRRAGSWDGVGVGEQGKSPQKIVNASTRALLNNAGKAAGSQFIIDRSAIRPMDGIWTITPDKLWEMMGDSATRDVRQAFMAIEIPNTTDELMKIIDLGMKLMEESTSIPLITQGQTGPTTPETLGATQIQDSNANQLLRSIGYSFDDYITEPLVRAYYEYLLLDPDVPNDEKGDFKINAHGSIALVERAIQDQTIAQMAPIAANPIYGADPKKWFKLYLKSKRINPEDVQYTKEQQDKIDAQPPPAAPQIEVAKINADVAMKELVAKQTGDQQSMQHEAQIEAGAQALEHQGQQVDATVRLHELQMRYDLEVMRYASDNRISINDAKVQLSKTAMTITAEKQLNAENNAHDMRKHRSPQPKPAVQVPGRAKNGQAAAQSQ